MATASSADVEPATTGLPGGRLLAQRLRAHGVTRLFTRSADHLFSLYDGCRQAGIDVVDVGHESTAAFAAEGWAKVTREPGVAALAAGPGITNGVSALASAHQNHSPMLVLGGRAPQIRRGEGSLPELDHVPFVPPLVKLATTARSTDSVHALVDDALACARQPPGGPVFLDLPLDVVLEEAEAPGTRGPVSGPPAVPTADPAGIDRAAALLDDAERPVIMAGTNLYWGRAEAALRGLSEERGIPVFLDSLARGCLPADHGNFFSRARPDGLKGADFALVIGTPLDFRLGFGGAFGPDCRIVVADVAEPVHTHPRRAAAEVYGALPSTLEALREATAGARDTSPWLRELRRVETARRQAEREQLEDDRAPLHPLRVYGELSQLLERDAVIVSDGGAFDSYAGRVIDSYQPGCWLDRGPFGCLGAGPGYALAAKLAHPDRQVVLLLGDGAFGFSGMEFETLARHDVDVVGVMGNNGIWALEHHPMTLLYGYSAAAELRPGTRYDQVVQALGGHGELVERPGQLRPALERAFAAGKPALVNVLTDPSIPVQHRSLVDRVMEVRAASCVPS